MTNFGSRRNQFLHAIIAFKKSHAKIAFEIRILRKNRMRKIRISRKIALCENSQNFASLREIFWKFFAFASLRKMILTFFRIRIASLFYIQCEGTSLTGSVVSRKDNNERKKVGEEHVVETEFVISGGYIRWNVLFTNGVSAPAQEEPVEACVQTEKAVEMTVETAAQTEPAKEESVEAGVQTEDIVGKPVEAAVQTEPEPEISPRMSPQPKEKMKICSFFGFSCQKE